MKAERRHELQHNELADWLAQAIERIKPYSRAIAGVILAAAVLLIAYVVLKQRAATKQSTAWNDYYVALQAPSKEGAEADLEAVAREHAGAAAGMWAEVSLADLQLGEGIGSLFTDKRAAGKKLANAVTHYETVLDKADDPLLVARARFGLARAQESLGKLDDARETYEQIVRASETDAYVAVAKSRLKDLDRDSTREFYAWFAEQEPAAAPASSFPGTPGERLPFDNSSFGPSGGLNLPGDRILNIPTLDTGTGPALVPDEKDKNTEKSAENGPADESARSKEGGDTDANAKDSDARVEDKSQTSNPKETSKSAAVSKAGKKTSD